MLVTELFYLIIRKGDKHTILSSEFWELVKLEERGETEDYAILYRECVGEGGEFDLVCSLKVFADGIVEVEGALRDIVLKVSPFFVSATPAPLKSPFILYEKFFYDVMPYALWFDEIGYRYATLQMVSSLARFLRMRGRAEEVRNCLPALLDTTFSWNLLPIMILSGTRSPTSAGRPELERADRLQRCVNELLKAMHRIDGVGGGVIMVLTDSGGYREYISSYISHLEEADRQNPDA